MLIAVFPHIFTSLHPPSIAIAQFLVKSIFSVYLNMTLLFTADPSNLLLLQFFLCTMFLHFGINNYLIVSVSTLFIIIHSSRPTNKTLVNNIFPHYLTCKVWYWFHVVLGTPCPPASV